MARLLFYLVLKPLSWLPLPVLHGFSSLLAWLFFSVTGYRRKVVMNNLDMAFPEKSETERLEIARRFYRSLCDIMVESIWMISASARALRKRCRFTNPEVLDAYAEQGKSVICAASHMCNFELGALALPLTTEKMRIAAIYSPLSNDQMEALFRRNRTRMGLMLVSRRAVKAYFENPPISDPVGDFFLADQAPSNAEPTKLHWTGFLSQITSFVAGLERYAVRYDRPVVYIYLRRYKRGYYEMTAQPLIERPRDTSPGQIMETYARTLEHEIRSHPADWLWTHRRWKRGVPDLIRKAWPPPQGYFPPQYDR